MPRVLGVLFLIGGAFAQTPAPRPEFEVASIKLNKSATPFVRVQPPRGGRFSATNIPIQFLVTMAYRIKDFQLSGAPAWWTSERYDIEAKADGNPATEQMLTMLQSLLEDRLQLKIHRETKELQVYALVVSKPGKLHPAEGECPPRPDGPLPAIQPGKLPSPPCGGFFMFPGRLTGQKVNIEALIDPLSRFTQKIVLDKTGLTGKYDINLEYTPDQSQLPGGLGPGGPAPPGLPPLPPIDPNGPTLTTALQEQLGLKLESQKGPVEMIVIDHVERPSEN